MEHLKDALDAIVANPPRLLSEAEVLAFERSLKFESRRERLMASPIRDSLGEGDEARILRDRCEPTKALRAVQHWVGKWTGDAASVTRPWLILAGPTGVGKTMAAAWAIAEVGARYVRFPDLIQDWRSHRRLESMEGHERQRNAFRVKYGFPGFMVLDELGIEGPGDLDEARTALHEFAEIRQRWAHRTLVLTNKSATELAERFKSGQYDARTLSRIERLLVTDREGNPMLALELGGTDMRRRAA